MPYISEATLVQSLRRLKGTAEHLVKIWFVLKVMGLREGSSVQIDTVNSTEALKRLFSFGDPTGKFFIPFAHTKRYMTMQHDASRSIIQTNIQRWATSDSVVTCNPSSYLDMSVGEDGKISVSQGRMYPFGLGYGLNGFATAEDKRVVIPDLSFAVWLFAKEEIPQQDGSSFLLSGMFDLLNMNESEMDLVFVQDDLEILLTDNPLSDTDINRICLAAIDEKVQVIRELPETFEQYSRRVKNMVTITAAPKWLNIDPKTQFQRLVDSGEKAVLIFGPPRTGKTRIIDQLISRNSEERVTIQMHEGWTYENLIIGLQPIENSEKFEWKYGPLGQAIKDGKKYVTLEEINRTKISQALGEVFSLLELAYRGEENAILLPNGDKLSISSDTLFVFTMNTIDESTEDVDDALLGRMACVEFPPRIEDLTELLRSNRVGEEKATRIKEVYNKILDFYPLGHGYFAGVSEETDFIAYYVARIRPTLWNHFQAVRRELIEQIDNVVDGVFK